MSECSLDSYLRSILEDGFPREFLERSADLLKQSQIDLRSHPEARLYLVRMTSVMEILTSESQKGEWGIVNEIKRELSAVPCKYTLKQWVNLLTSRYGDCSLEVRSLAVGLYAYHSALKDDSVSFPETFVRGWISLFDAPSAGQQA